MLIVNDGLQNTAGTISRRVDLSESAYVVTISMKSRMSFKPGQFVHVRIEPQSCKFVLRRPFSVYDSTFENGKTNMRLFIKVFGKASEYLKTLPEGTEVELLGPLGNAFEENPPQRRAVCVAGGVGIAPFKTLIPALKQRGIRTTLIYGARTKRDLYLMEDFSGTDEIITCTDDGSHGRKGFVTEALRELLARDRNVIVQCCGPDAMCVLIGKMCSNVGVPCQISLERRMGCALGACRACVTKVRDGSDWKYSRICCEGTVYYASDLIFENGSH